MTGMKEGRPQVREYRASLWLPLFVIVFFGGFGLTVLRPVFEEDMPIALAIVMVAVVASVYFLLVVLVCLSRTVVDEDHVAVRRLFRTRRTAWRDIQGIEIEGNPGAVVDGRQPAGVVVVHHRDGRRITLPHLHDKRGLSVHQEVLAIRAVWERRRGGDDWAPRPDAEAAVAKAKAVARTRTAGTVMAAGARGGSAAMGTLGVLGLCFLISMFTGALDALSEIPEGLFLGAFMGLPMVAFAAAFLISIARDRRRQPPGPGV